MESRGPHKDAYGTSRLIDILDDYHNLEAGELAETIETDISRFIGGHEQHDDITMVVLKHYKDVDGIESEDYKGENNGDMHKDANVNSITINHKKE